MYAVNVLIAFILVKQSFGVSEWEGEMGIERRAIEIEDGKEWCLWKLIKITEMKLDTFKFKLYHVYNMCQIECHSKQNLHIYIT